MDDESTRLEIFEKSDGDLYPAANGNYNNDVYICMHIKFILIILCNSTKREILSKNYAFFYCNHMLISDGFLNVNVYINFQFNKIHAVFVKKYWNKLFYHKLKQKTSCENYKFWIAM